MPATWQAMLDHAGDLGLPQFWLQIFRPRSRGLSVSSVGAVLRMEMATRETNDDGFVVRLSVRRSRSVNECEGRSQQLGLPILVRTWTFDHWSSGVGTSQT